MATILIYLRMALIYACDIYVGVIIIYILMSWLPNHGGGWIGDIYRALGRICDPYLNLFRRIIPPIGGMLDISPILAIIVLQLIARLISMLMGSLIGAFL